MKIMAVDTDEGAAIEISQLYNGVIIAADNGIKMAVCQRDGRFEIHHMTDGEHWTDWVVYPPREELVSTTE